MNSRFKIRTSSINFSLLPQLSSQHPIHCFIENTDEKENNTLYIITVYGIDTYGILSHIVGAISLQGIEIISGHSQFTIHDGKNIFYNEFLVDTGKTSSDTWTETLKSLILTQGSLICNGHRTDALQTILEYIAEDYQKHPPSHEPIIDISINESKALPHIQNLLEVSVEGQDMRYLLYMLSLALEREKLMIHTFSVETHDSHIQDYFLVEPQSLENMDYAQLRLKLLLTVQFAYYLKLSANPYKALLRFQKIIGDTTITHGEDIKKIILQQTELTSFFAQMFGSSDFLWEDFIKINSQETIKAISSMHTKDKPVAADIGLHPSEYESHCDEICKKHKSFEKQIQALNSFKDSQNYFIDLDIFLHHHNDFKELGYRLSKLARTVVKKAVDIIYTSLTKTYGTPRSVAGMETHWAICGLGALGGEALGYASDIEIMMIYEDAGNTDGKTSIPNREFFSKMLQMLYKNISSKQEGFFHIDTRLRPYGNAGPLAVRLDNFLKYYDTQGEAHSVEKLALSRMKYVAGSPEFAERVLSLKDKLLYSPNSIHWDEVFELRKSQFTSKVKPNSRNAKFSLGALVDVEYNIQMLQVKHGATYPKLRQANVHNVMTCLEEVGEISNKEYNRIISAYSFFRLLVNALRLRRGHANDLTLPAENTWELEHLARRMSYVSKEIHAGRKLIADFDDYSTQVYEFVKKHLGSSATPAKNMSPAAIVFSENLEDISPVLHIFKNKEQAFTIIQDCSYKHLKNEEILQMFSRILLLAWHSLEQSGDSDRVLRDFSRIIKNISSEKENEETIIFEFYQSLLKQPTRLDILLQIIISSRYLSEEIIKNPAVIDFICDAEIVQKRKTYDSYNEELSQIIEQTLKQGNTDSYNNSLKNNQENQHEEFVMQSLRSFKKRETLRIITRDICLASPFENIVKEISYLARAIVNNALTSVLKQYNYLNNKIPIAVLAFGKLGSVELNYSSDIDLLCIYDESSVKEINAIQIFKSMLKHIHTYTEDGKLYRIDLRLRPFGSASSIAQKLSYIKNYYHNDAQLWELQAALKLGYVAGNQPLATNCLTEIHQALIFRIKKFSLRQIAENISQLRQKSVEEYTKNIDETFEIKNSWGGLRDIEFSIQMLQLIHINSISRVPDTIGAVRILQNASTFSAEKAENIINNYRFLRRVEHFLQVYDDRQLHAIPLQDNTFMKRLTWLMTKKQDIQAFIHQLLEIKKQSHALYTETIEQYKQQ